ncbi:MAG: restriction endonuclease [Nitrospirae bacterium]|nr:restriction endonuclease [Nitrospirota bacterium]
MFDVFTEEIEVQIKTGISHLYWFKEDLRKAWLRSGVAPGLCNSIFSRTGPDSKKLTKRELMNSLYIELRGSDINRRLEVSRNFVRILTEHNNFVPQDEKHRVEIAERCALKLREIIAQQQKEAEYRDLIRNKVQRAKKEDYHSQLLPLRAHFYETVKMDKQKRGYELEKIFSKLMTISGIPVEESFKIVGEQMDGAIKYDGHYYIVELKWIEKKADQKNVASLYMKVEGKMEAKGIFIAMNGFTNELLSSLPKGKNLKVLLLDGIHLTNVISGIYTFQELLEHAISHACLRGEIYCSHEFLK